MAPSHEKETWLGRSVFIIYLTKIIILMKIDYFSFHILYGENKILSLKTDGFVFGERYVENVA